MTTSRAAAVAAMAVAAWMSGCPAPATGSDAGGDVEVEAETSGGPTLVINEIVCDQANGGDDWIELYASGTAPVMLSDYQVRDDDPSRPPATLPDVTLQPGEYFVVTADSNDPGDGTPWVPFKLGGGDAVVLSQDGRDLQTLDWDEGDAPQGTAYGLVADGDVANAGTLVPTPGAANVPWEGPLPTDLDLFKGDVVYPLALELSAADWADMQANALAETWYRGALTMDGHTVADIGIRTKSVADLRVVHGDATKRFSFRVDANRFVKGQRIDGRRGFVLNNNYLDPTMMREVLAYEAFREAGIVAPKTQYVDVTVAGEHLGLYVLVELVDKEFLQDYFPDDDDGDLYEPEPPAGTLQYVGDDPALYPKMGLETNTSTSTGATFVSLVKALHDDTFDARLDTAGTAAYIAVNVLLGNLDSYMGAATNFYLYDFNARFFVIPWDLDRAFGSFDCDCGTAALETLPMETPTCVDVSLRPLVAKLLARPDLLAVYEGRLTELTSAGGPFTAQALNARIATLRTVIAPTLEADPTKLFSAVEAEENLDASVVKPVTLTGAPDRVMPGLRPFIAARVASVKAQLANTEARRGPGQAICGIDP